MNRAYIGIKRASLQDELADAELPSHPAKEGGWSRTRAKGAGGDDGEIMHVMCILLSTNKYAFIILFLRITF